MDNVIIVLNPLLSLALGSNSSHFGRVIRTMRMRRHIRIALGMILAHISLCMRCPSDSPSPACLIDPHFDTLRPPAAIPISQTAEQFESLCSSILVVGIFCVDAVPASVTGSKVHAESSIHLGAGELGPYSCRDTLRLGTPTSHFSVMSL